MLEQLVDERRLEELLNKRSPVYKELDLGNRKLTKDEAIDLMLREPNLIRRPIVLKGRKAVFGFSPEEYEKLVD